MAKAVLILLAAFVSAVLAQGPGNLNSYAEIREELLRGAEIQLNADSEQCAASNTQGPILISMPLRHWQLVTTEENGEWIRADDFYVNTPPGDTALFILRQLRINDDESVELQLVFAGQGEELPEPVTLSCAIGEGATAHRVVPGNDLETIDQYNEVKSLLLLGNHVEAVVDLGQCSNAGEVLPAGVNYVTGFQTHIFAVINDATPEEFLVVDDTAFIGTQNGTEAVTAEQLVVFPDNSAIVTIAILDPMDLSQLNNLTLNCELGPAVRFVIHGREIEGAFITYEELRESTLAGHDLEGVIFVDTCELLAGEELHETGVIYSARFDGFELVPAGSMAGNDLERIDFTGYVVTVDGNVLIYDIRVSEDDLATVEYFDVMPGSDVESDYHLLSCPLGDSLVFHAVGRDRAPVSNYNQIIQDIRERGQTFEIEIDFTECDTEGFPLDVIFGGIIWESYVNPARDGFFFGSIHTLAQVNVTGTLSPAWEASDILILPDETVLVTPRLYDFATGANLLPDLPQDPIACALSNGGGGPSGSRGARLYRYP